MWKTRMLGVCWVVALCQCGLAIAEESASESILWMQRTPVQKEAYLDGLCDAFKFAPNTPEGEMTCKPFDSKVKSVSRFCAARWAFKDGRTDSTPGIQVFDQFYADKDHSDLPSWTVIATFNDKACGEDRVTSRLAPMQAKLVCFRQRFDMIMNKFPAQAIEAQGAACNAMK